MIALAIVSHQVREMLLEEGKKDRGRARLQKQRPGENVARPSRCGGAHHGLEIGRRVRNAGQNRRATDAYADARFAELANRIEPQIGTRRARLQNARQFDVEGCDGDVNRKCVVACDFAQKIEIANDEI